MILTEKYKKRLIELAGIEMVSKDEELNEIEIEDIKLPAKFVHNELNPSLFHKGKLYPEVREKLLSIAMEFYKELEIDAKIIDVKIPGSMAGFTYTEHSDIDIHIYFCLKDISTDEKFALEYLNAKVQLWREKHQDINIKGYPVEIYAQSIKDDYYRGGVYSLLKGKWETKPSRENVTINKQALKAKIKAIGDRIEKLEAYKNPESIYEIATKLIDRIKKMRKCGLSKQGEFSIENLAFKYLRNSGYIKRLIAIKTAAFNRKLSLD